MNVGHIYVPVAGTREQASGCDTVHIVVRSMQMQGSGCRRGAKRVRCRRGWQGWRPAVRHVLGDFA